MVKTNNTRNIMQILMHLLDHLEQQKIVNNNNNNNNKNQKLPQKDLFVITNKKIPNKEDKPTHLNPPSV